ncbi:hypothetical protein Q5752_003397 [Cryptotrichosporon argae]
MPSSPPPRFYAALGLYHLFPLHAPLTLWVVDAPFGRFSQGGRWHVDGNLAWAAMELVAPVTFVVTLLRGPTLAASANILSALYLIHYAHRAVVSPLLLSPPRSPQHIIVPLAAGLFNLMNAYLLATGLAWDPPPTRVGSPAFWLPIVGWALCFAGNVYHDEILNDLRRPRGKRLISDPKDAGGRYKVPHGALFGLVSFPNYLCEWLEWACFALAAAPGIWAPAPAHPTASWQSRLLPPPWMFVLAEISIMTPRAIRGHRWYRDKFDDYPPGRKAVVPWLL